MTEQQTEQSGHETGSLGAKSAVPDSSDARIDRSMASTGTAVNVESAEIVPGPDESAKPRDKALEFEAAATKAAMPKAEPFTVQGVEGDAPDVDGAKAAARHNDTLNPDTSTTDAVSVATRLPRELLIMSPGERTRKHSEDRFESGNSDSKPGTDVPGRGRRFAAMAAMLLLAVIAGAAGGVFATIGQSHFTEATVAAAPNFATLEASVGRVDADIMALKARLERTTNESLTQSNKTSDRLERIEKAQAEPAAKLAKLSDAVDKLRAATPVATTPVPTAAPKDVTGTVTTPANAQALPTPQLHASPSTTAAGNAPLNGVGRLPTVESWVLRDVSRGMALIEGRSGLYEVFAGDPVPGLGRVDAIRKQDGRWVVVTSKGLIVAR